MKKTFSLILICFLLMTTLLAGCGGGKDQPVADQKQPAETADKGAADKEAGVGDIFARSKEIKSMTFDWVLTGTGGLVSEGKQYIQGENIRMDTSTPEGNVTMIFNASTNEAWMVNESQNIAMKMGGGAEVESESVDPLEAIDEEDMEAYQIIGHEKYDGKDCTVMEMNYDGEYAKIWVWDKYGFPLKYESKVEGEQIIWEYKNVSFDKIPDSVFEIPAGIQVMDMSSMTNLEGMPDMNP